MKKMICFILMFMACIGVARAKDVVIEPYYGDDYGYEIIEEGDYVCLSNEMPSYMHIYAFKNGSFYQFISSSYSATFDYDKEKYCFTMSKENMYDADNMPEQNKFLFYYEKGYYGGYEDFALSPYFEPKLNVTCDKESLKYGETSECILSYDAAPIFNPYNYSYSSDNCMTSSHVTFDETNFKITDFKDDLLVEDYYSTDYYTYDYSYTDDDGLLLKSDYNPTKFGSNVYYFNNDSNYYSSCSIDKKNFLMRFTVTPASPEVAGEKLEIQVNSTDFTDYSGKRELSTLTNLSVVGEVKNDEDNVNPNTFSNSTIYIVIAISGISLILIAVLYKQMKLKRHI